MTLVTQLLTGKRHNFDPRRKEAEPTMTLGEARQLFEACWTRKGR